MFTIHYLSSRVNGSRIAPITVTDSLQSRESWPLSFWNFPVPLNPPFFPPPSPLLVFSLPSPFFGLLSPVFSNPLPPSSLPVAPCLLAPFLPFFAPFSPCFSFLPPLPPLFTHFHPLPPFFPFSAPCVCARSFYTIFYARSSLSTCLVFLDTVWGCFGATKKWSDVDPISSTSCFEKRPKIK